MPKSYITLLSLLLFLTGFTAIADEMSDTCLIATETTAIEVPTADVDTTTEQTDSVQVEGVDTISAQLEGLLCCFLMEPSHYKEYRGPDFKFFKNTTNYSIEPYTFMQDQTWVGIPVFFAGMLAKYEKTAFRQNYNNANTDIRLIKYNFHSEIDNYLQFSGVALTAGLKLAGVEGRSSWPRLFTSAALSYSIMAGFVNTIKYTSSEMRPDFTTRNSWPSGHTATAFVGATILHKEYGLTRSPWYSIAGYSLATATGVMRVLNNRHWISDVLSGAGIGILSTELAYGFCDLLFKEKGLLMNDLAYYPDLSKNPSFFSISMGIGFGNKHLSLPPLNLGRPGDADIPLELKFRSATAVGVEGAWFFSKYVGIGGRLRVKSTPINGWSNFTEAEGEYLKWITSDPNVSGALHHPILLSIESDHITEFAADAGVYFSLPISSRFAIGTKLLGGRSVMDDIEVDGTFAANVVERQGRDFIATDRTVLLRWSYINVSASNSSKLGSGLSLTYAHKNSFSWRVFCDYDYSVKTFKATYAPMLYLPEFAPEVYNQVKTDTWDPANSWTTSVRKHLHQWVLGGALCISL